MNDQKVSALGLLSGGLDSTLAVKLIIDQGIHVIAAKFTSPFCLCDQKGRCHAKEVAMRYNIPFKIISADKGYLNILRKPKYGYGSGVNPCIDCRIYMLKKAKIYADKVKADFIFTGEVLGQRPMSQHSKALKIIEKESSLEGKILRPLSARLLPETEAEKKGLVDRNKLLTIQGRSRKRQMELAEELNIADYPCPAGGCLLTYKEFASKTRDLFNFKKRIDHKDLLLLRIGRHFRIGLNKIIVGRNEEENTRLKVLRKKNDYLFEVPNCGSPLTILQGPKHEKAVKTAAALTARYSDNRKSKVRVSYGITDLKKSIAVDPLNEDLLCKLRV